MPALKAAQELAPLGIDAAVVNARFVKPLDRDLLVGVLSSVPRALTVEDNVVAGGFGSAVAELMVDEGIAGVSLRRLGVPDPFIPHRTPGGLKKPPGFAQHALT